MGSSEEASGVYRGALFLLQRATHDRVQAPQVEEAERGDAYAEGEEQEHT